MEPREPARYVSWCLAEGKRMSQTRFVWGAVGNSGDNATSGNSGANVITTGGTATLTDTPAGARIGALAALMTATTTSGGVYVGKDLTAGLDYAADRYLYITAYPSAEIPILAFLGGGIRMVSVALSATGQILIKDKPFATIATLPAVPLNTLIRVAMYSHMDSVAGTVQVAWFTGHSTTPTQDSGLLTGRNTGTASFESIRFGIKTSTGVQTGADTIASYAYDDAATGLTSPYDPNVAPTANAGTDQIVLPGVTVTLDGSGSSDSDGSIVSYVWAQTSGDAVSIAGSGSTRTFAAPYDMTEKSYGFQLTVTDNGGATAVDSTNVTVTAHPEWYLDSGGSWKAEAHSSL